MSAVSNTLKQTIKELQTLSSLSNFALAGGTNLALRYNHRISEDIDLFCNIIIGSKGYAKIEKEVKDFYGDKVQQFIYPCKINDQFTFLRFFIHKPNLTIKIELLQNMKTLYDVEITDDIRLIAKKDIGLFKLVSASSRAGKKDIYDLDYITDDIPIIDLYKELEIKKSKFNNDIDKSIFDLNGDECPTNNPMLLLKFDGNSKVDNSKPFHSNDKINNIEESKTWITARTSWRMKVRKLFRHLNITYPLN
jgi:Nucleotidyl transferase AbiEii toxin, Type IV TA system